MRAWVLVAALAGGLISAPATAAPGQDITARLKKIPGMKVIGRGYTAPKGYRSLRLSFTQPVDHRDPGKGTFQQRLELFHRATDQPMVLSTSGYGLRVPAPLAEPTRAVRGNQVSVEQRFFNKSRPKGGDWSTLTIWQAASDHHRLVAALKSIYKRKWISTGASKGGMTSVYHARFFPKDVNGVVAYVAPNDVDDNEDSAYDRFFQTVGTAACRKKLQAVTVEALRRRAAMQKRMLERDTFNQLGVDVAFEHAVMDLDWTFWQYSSVYDCARIPTAKASNDALYRWLEATTYLSGNSDGELKYYRPYYYQAATELGSPKRDYGHLQGLLKHEGYDPRTYAKVTAPFQTGAMKDIDTWVRGKGTRLMFVYGQNDPWSAEPFRRGPGTKDSYWYTVKNGTHGADLFSLPKAQRAQAVKALLRWTGQRKAGPLTPYRVRNKTVIGLNR